MLRIKKIILMRKLLLPVTLLVFLGLMSLNLLMATPSSASLVLGTKNADSTALWSTAQIKSGCYSVYLNSGSVTAGDGDEARIRITMPAGTTLNDINSISWWEFNVAGYPPHVDIKIDTDGNGTEDDALVIEYAYNGHIGETPMPYGAVLGAWYKTFSDDGNGPSVIDNTAYAWLSSGPAGGPGIIGGTLTQWKAGSVGGSTVNGDIAVIALEIEVDNWVVSSEAYVDDIAINGVSQYGSIPDAPLVLSTKNAQSTAQWSTAQVKNGYSSVLLDTGSVTAGDGDEARIKIPMPAGTTLSDISSISWWEYNVLGYPPHVDIKVDTDGNGTEDDALVIEYAHNSMTHYAVGSMPYGAVTGAWYQTFNDDGDGPSVIDNAAFAWLSSGAAGPPPPDGVNFIGGTLANWKAGAVVGSTISGTTAVTALEIEVDNWVVNSKAYVDDIAINWVSQYGNVDGEQCYDGNTIAGDGCTATCQLEGLPDLVISSITGPSTAEAGESIDVKVMTKNKGSGWAASTITRLYFSTDTILDDSDTPLGSSDIPALAAGVTNIVLSISVTIPTGIGGKYYIIAKADADAAITETNETNNTKSMGKSVSVGSDLFVYAFTAPKTADADTDISITDKTKNKGPANADASTTRFYLSTNMTLDAGDGSPLGSRPVDPLAAKESSVATTSVHLPTGIAGIYYIIVKADADNDLAETNEDNNTRFRKIEISGGPNLVVSLSAPLSAGAGDSIDVYDTTANTGSVAAGASTTRFYLSTNNTFNSGDTPLGSRAVPELAATSGSSTETTSLIIPEDTEGGTYYIIARADANGQVAETNEKDNTGSSAAITISP
jgi:cysteine-rich repeat protein